MDNPQFTIVTPSFNYAKYIRECLDSVRNQEGVTVEHLVFDAGSTDGSLDILREYPHVNLTVEPDKGMSDAINKGFRRARGEWVMWLNTDDRLLPGSLKAVADFAANHPEADVIHGAFNYIDADGHFLRRATTAPYVYRVIVQYGCYLASTAMFFRKSTIMDQGFLLNDKFHYVMDGEFYARLGKAGKCFVPFNKPLADFRLHDESLSRRGRHQTSVDECLLACRRHAESMAIKRAYGWTFTKNLKWSMVWDALLSSVFWPVKCLLQLFQRWEK